jgi:acetoin utilization deacetylase AcuC-like enzyme
MSAEKRPRLVTSPKYTVDIGGHVFPTRKFELAAKLLEGKLPFIEPQEPSRDDLLLAHDASWVDKVVNCAMSLDDQTLMELPFSKEISLAHRLSAGGTIMACRDALETGVGLHCGGGSHHAFAGHGEGFCVINDIAVGVIKMRVERRISRAAVVDLDVHHGNGTAAIFAGDPDVFTFSMHQDGIYPERRPPSSLDIGLKAGTRDERYLALLEENLPAVFEHQPELVVYQAGVDCHENDLLGGLKLTAAGLAKRDALVREACRRREVPVAVTLGGGYAEDPRETAALHARTLETFFL